MAEILTKNEILSLTEIFEKVRDFITKLKKEYTLAEHIQYPKTPTELSESLAVHLIKDKKISLNIEPLTKISFGGSEADIIAKSGKNKYKIEVKATMRDFQYFGKKDISCDYLIWIDLKKIFDNTNKFTVYTIHKPGTYFNKPRKITLNQFEKECRYQMLVKEFDLKSYLNQK